MARTCATQPSSRMSAEVTITAPMRESEQNCNLLDVDMLTVMKMFVGQGTQRSAAVLHITSQFANG